MTSVSYVTFIVTFVLFFSEAILHYNIGLTKGSSSLIGLFTNLTFPRGKPLFDIVMVLVIFSGMNTYLIPFVTNMIDDSRKNAK